MNERNPMETFKMHSQEEEEISHPDIYGIDLEGPIPELQNEDSVVIPGGRLCLIDFRFVPLRRLLADCFPLGVKSIAWAEGSLERLELVSLPLLL